MYFLLFLLYYVYLFMQHLYANFYTTFSELTCYHHQSSATDIPLYSVVDKSKKKNKMIVSANAVRDVS